MPGFNRNVYPTQKLENDNLFTELDSKIQKKFIGQDCQIKYQVTFSVLSEMVMNYITSFVFCHKESRERSHTW